MSSPNERHRSAAEQNYRIELAEPADGPALAAIYNSDDGFGGEIAVKFTREPDPFASLLADGDGVVVPVVREVASGRLIGMGACVTRQAWVNGEQVKVGYLTGLKALPEFRRGVPLIPQVYAFLRAQTPDVRCYYTTILTENTLARRLLERNRRGMPEYRPVGEYVTHCFRVAGRRSAPRTILRSGSVAELVELTAASGGRFNLAAVDAPPSVRDADVRILRDQTGRALAWCAAVDQRATKQYVITKYGGRYERIAKLPVHWTGYPRLPRPGIPANYVSIAALGAAHDDPALIGQLLRAVGAEERDRDFAMIGLAAGHRFEAALDGLRTISYSSQLYTVHFDENCVALDERPIDLDVGLL